MSRTSPSPDALRRALNVHGFGFHYAVIQRIMAVQGGQFAPWEFVGAEIPLTLNDSEIHADFVFYRPKKPMYLIGECKRPDPALNHWCFARSGYSLGQTDQVTIDELWFPRVGENKVQIRPARLASHTQHWYQVGVGVRGQQKGDGVTPDRKAITESVTQVSRSTNGFIQLCADNPYLLKTNSQAVRFLSVVFTTAGLSGCPDDLAIADLETGDLPDSCSFKEVQFLWYQHALNKSMQANVQGRFIAENTPDWQTHFSVSAVRTTAIVGWNSIQQFFHQLDHY